MIVVASKILQNTTRGLRYGNINRGVLDAGEGFFKDNLKIQIFYKINANFLLNKIQSLEFQYLRFLSLLLYKFPIYIFFPEFSKLI